MKLQDPNIIYQRITVTALPIIMLTVRAAGYALDVET